MPPRTATAQGEQRLSQLEAAQRTAQRRGTAAETSLRDLNTALSRVRDGDLSDVQVSDPLLQTTLDEYDRSIADLDKSAYQTDQYQALARGAYRTGGRAGRRLLAEGRDQINLNLSQLQQQVRAQRINAIQTYRQSQQRIAESERRLQLELGQQAYQTGAAEEERVKRQNDEYRETFLSKILAGEPLDENFVASFSEESGRDISEIQTLIEEAGNNAINSVRQLARQAGVALNEEEIDFSSTESTVASIREQIEGERARQIQREVDADARASTALELNLRQEQRQIAQFEHQRYVDLERLKIQRRELNARLSSGSGGGSGCSALKSEKERAKCLVDEGSTLALNALPQGFKDDADVQILVKGLLQRHTASGDQTNKEEFDSAVRRTVADPGFAEAFAQAKASHIPEVRDALQTGDTETLVRALEGALFGNDLLGSDPTLTPEDAADFYYRSAHIQAQRENPDYLNAVEAAREEAIARGIPEELLSTVYHEDLLRQIDTAVERGEAVAVTRPTYRRAADELIQQAQPRGYPFTPSDINQYLGEQSISPDARNSASLTASKSGIPNPGTPPASRVNSLLGGVGGLTDYFRGLIGR